MHFLGEARGTRLACRILSTGIGTVPVALCGANSDIFALRLRAAESETGLEVESTKRDGRSTARFVGEVLGLQAGIRMTGVKATNFF